jgi:hypothetical protein
MVKSKRLWLKMVHLLILIVIISPVGCASVKTKDYTKFHQVNPRSVLIVPPINNTTEVGAEDYFLATVSLPLAERGYYVFPVNMSKELLAEAGLSDPGLVHQADPSRLGKLFGADAILYINIENWEARYLILNTTVTVAFSYQMKDAASGEEIWSHHQVIQYTPQNSNTGNLIANLLVAAVNAAVTKAAPNYIPLARQANSTAFISPNEGIPAGPYSKTNPP